MIEPEKSCTPSLTRKGTMSLEMRAGDSSSVRDIGTLTVRP